MYGGLNYESLYTAFTALITYTGCRVRVGVRVGFILHHSYAPSAKSRGQEGHLGPLYLIQYAHREPNGHGLTPAGQERTCSLIIES